MQHGDAEFCMLKYVEMYSYLHTTHYTDLMGLIFMSSHFVLCTLWHRVMKRHMGSFAWLKPRPMLWKNDSCAK